MRRILVVGAGAAGYFAAIRAKELSPASDVVLLESGDRTLRKVKISGGGRCNVTHSCFEPEELVRSYPRGHKELHSSFKTFQPLNTIEWFENRGVKLKVESDGRMFPVTDNSQTIIDCLESERIKLGIKLRLKTKLKAISVVENGFQLNIDDLPENFSRVILATGSSKEGYELASLLGHTIEPLVPSLFTFVVRDETLISLSGVSFTNVRLKLKIEGGKDFKQEGPLLITHWGVSGPAVIKLSAWAAKELAEKDYKASLLVNWIPDFAENEILEELQQQVKNHPTTLIQSKQICDLTKRFWERVVKKAGCEIGQTFATLKASQRRAIVENLRNEKLFVDGKGVFKEEFVTCGGVALKEIDLRTMESNIVPGLFFAGEILNVDGITGGFNFQNAWTSGWIAGGGATV